MRLPRLSRLPSFQVWCVPDRDHTTQSSLGGPVKLAVASDHGFQNWDVLLSWKGRVHRSWKWLQHDYVRGHEFPSTDGFVESPLRCII